MIKIVLADWPDKHKVGPEDIEQVTTAAPVDCYFETRISYSGLPYTRAGRQEALYWDVEVFLVVSGWSVRVPRLCRTVNTADMLLELMLYDNGEADAWVRQLLGDLDADGLWERYREVTA